MGPMGPIGMPRRPQAGPVHYPAPPPPPPPGGGSPHFRGDRLVPKQAGNRSYHGGPMIARSVFGGQNPGHHFGLGHTGYPVQVPVGPHGGGAGSGRHLGQGPHEPMPFPDGGGMFQDAGHRRGGGADILQQLLEAAGQPHHPVAQMLQALMQEQQQPDLSGMMHQGADLSGMELSPQQLGLLRDLYNTRVLQNGMI